MNNYLKSRGIKLATDGKTEYTDSPSWNAKSVYFYDADENILEFIARYNLKENTTDKEFCAQKHILNVSEIGIAVSDTQKLVDEIHRHTGLIENEVIDF